jgi:hypothetical protein
MISLEILVRKMNALKIMGVVAIVALILLDHLSVNVPKIEFLQMMDKLVSKIIVLILDTVLMDVKIQ